MNTVLAILLASNIYTTNCAGCHGDKGQGIPGYSPKLSGQHWQYLNSQIKDIKNGDRTNGNSKVMVPMFRGLTDKQIRDLSKYMQKLK